MRRLDCCLLVIVGALGCSSRSGASGAEGSSGSVSHDAATETAPVQEMLPPHDAAVVILFPDVTVPQAATSDPSEGDNCARAIKAVVRDFRASDAPSGPRHPDFEGTFGGYKGIVKPLLGTDDKPVYAGTGPTPATTGPTEFDQWYRDVDGINMRFDDIVLPLTESTATPKTFVYDNQQFFPIDGRGWDDVELEGHNFAFTTEIHLTFPYRGGEFFTFRGDDDVFLFINGHLAIDLGGVHPAEQGDVNLDQQAAALGIEPNHTYRMDIFQAERHTSYSTFRIETSLQCVTNVTIQ